AQLLTASLPADKRKWRAGSKAEEMRKPNRLVRELVEDRLNEQDSPLGRAMARVQEYARRRRRTEGLARAEEKRLVENAREEIMQRSINGVYAVLRGLPEDWLEVRTPMLDVMTLDYERLKEAAQESRTDPADDGLVEFGFRLRSYSSRLRYHQEKRADYREKVRDYDSRAGIGMTSAESVVMRNHWAIEEEYHAKCASKYRHLLTFMPPESVWRNEWPKLRRMDARSSALKGSWLIRTCAGSRIPRGPSRSDSRSTDSTEGLWPAPSKVVSSCAVESLRCVRGSLRSRPQLVRSSRIWAWVSRSSSPVVMRRSRWTC